MARGVDGMTIFTDDHERVRFLSDLERLELQTSANVLAYCLMGNHFHLAIQVGPVGLSSFMQRLKSGHAERFNARHGRTGHLFQGRFKSKPCHDDGYLNRVIRYIHRNPVKAGFVATPEEWPWSSIHRFGNPAGSDDSFDPWAETPAPALHLDIGPVGLTEIAVAMGLNPARLKARSRESNLVESRRRLTTAAIQAGHSLTAIAQWLDTNVSSVSRYARAELCNNARPDPLIR